MQANVVRPFHDLKTLWQNAKVRATEAKSALEIAQRALSVAENCSLLVQSSVMSPEAAADLVVAAKNRLEATQKELQEAEVAVQCARFEYVGLRTAPPDALVCPLTLELMSDPVVASDGHSYERKAIEAVLLRESPTSPLTREDLLPSLVPNHALRKRIEEHAKGLDELAEQLAVRLTSAMEEAGATARAEAAAEATSTAGLTGPHEEDDHEDDVEDELEAEVEADTEIEVSEEIEDDDYEPSDDYEGGHPTPATRGIGGMALHLSRRSKSGYLHVSQRDGKHGKHGPKPFHADISAIRKRGHEGHVRVSLGYFATAVEAATAVAKYLAGDSSVAKNVSDRRHAASNSASLRGHSVVRLSLQGSQGAGPELATEAGAQPATPAEQAEASAASAESGPLDNSPSS